MANKLSQKKGIDVSKWNVIRNYDAVKKEGVDFAIVRAVQGESGTKDKLFDTHCTGFKTANIPIIASYIYAYCNTDESAKRISAIAAELCVKAGIKQLELDLEDQCMMGLGKKIIPIINRFKTTAESAKLQFGIYTGAQFYNPYLKPYLSDIGHIPIWWARYPYSAARTIKSDPPSESFLPTNVPLEGWQYSSKGLINGIEGYVDMNVWYDEKDFINTEDSPNSSVLICIYLEPKRILKKGERGDDVKWVQWYLWRFGCFIGTDGKPDASQIDGIFGSRTETAVKQAQRNLGMKETGYVTTADRAIWKKLV